MCWHGVSGKNSLSGNQSVIWVLRYFLNLKNCLSAHRKTFKPEQDILHRARNSCLPPPWNNSIWKLFSTTMLENIWNEHCFLPSCLKTSDMNIVFYQGSWKHLTWTLLSTKLHLPLRKDRSSPLHRAQPRLVTRPGGSKCWKCPLTRRCSIFNVHWSMVNVQMIHFQEDLPCH